jgi:predicted MFS family arabinose efflux permease
MFAVCLDIGGDYAGAVVGAMNTSAQVGSFVSSLAFGYLVERYGSYNVPFAPMTVLLLIGAGLWLKVDPSKRLVPQKEVLEMSAVR